MSEFRDVKGKVAIVTGASRGIGSSIAETLASEGIHVVMNGSTEKVRESFKKIKNNFPENNGFFAIFDVADEKMMKKLTEDTITKLGRIDIFVNNAGMHRVTGNVWETEEKDIDKVIAVNFKGQFFGCKYASIQMIKQKSGTIVNIGSWYGKVGHAGSALYGASKAAVHTMTQALAMELAPYGITVNALCPGQAMTDMHLDFMKNESKERNITFEQLKQEELERIPLGRYGTGEELAGAIMWLASESGSYVTGQLINVNGGVDKT